MKRVLLLCLLFMVPVAGAQDEPVTFIACDETLFFEMPDGFLVKEFAPTLDEDEMGGQIILATLEELLEAFPAEFEPGDMHISLTRQPAEEDVEPAEYLATFSQFDPVSLAINDYPAAVVYQQDPQSGIQQILLVMVISEDTVLWLNASTLDHFTELELLTDALVQSLAFMESPLDEDLRYYFTEDCQTRFEYPVDWILTPSESDIALTPVETDVPILTIIPPERLWEDFEEPALVTINQLFNTYIEIHDISTDSDVEWDGENLWTLDTENGFVMVRSYNDEQLAMFIVNSSNDEQIETKIDKILASFSVNTLSD